MKILHVEEKPAPAPVNRIAPEVDEDDDDPMSGLLADREVWEAEPLPVNEPSPQFARQAGAEFPQIDARFVAENVYGSRNLTSPRSGTLKAEAVAHFAQCLRSHGIEYLQEVPKVADSTSFEADGRGIPGQQVRSRQLERSRL